ncbi:MAG: hypothetical protein RLZZ398_739 [Verrucomicrobiota bacterium]|jgi:hypothetical protein
MNAVEIADAVSTLMEQPFDRDNFPFAFLEAFGNKETTLKKLRSGDSNKSDLGGVLQRSNIHLKVCAPGEVAATLKALRESPATARLKAKFILATDGDTIEAENLADDDEPIVCAYTEFSDHFGYFLPLAGITTVKQIRESSFDIKATGRLNRLYIELLKDNPEWATAARREDLNHFMARLIFCFFAEDTDIFHGEGLFSSTVEQMSAGDPSKTGEVISELFRAMNLSIRHEGKISNFHRDAAGIPNWANVFPYVNGGLFSDSVEVPRFSRIARAYLLKVGELPWQKINPDIFGSMIQAVADDEERGALGMHYTSVPNILKVLNPLFLDELRARLEDAGDSPQKLLNLRKRIARIRVFDPACGSGNFLVIAYKQLRAIEAEIKRRRGEIESKSEIPLTNFRGIELRDFSAEIARLALIIAEYQCDVHYRGESLALAEFLPLEQANWITCGNALRVDWLSVCPPTGTGVKLRGDDLFSTPRDQSEIDFQNEGGETYICGNPPYLGSKWQSAEQKADLKTIFDGRTKSWKSLDYVAGWFMKAADYGFHTPTASAFVSTNSICQGQQVPILWPLIFASGHVIHFAHTSFKWANLASHNAGVTVVIAGISNHPEKTRYLFALADDDGVVVKVAENINAYLVGGPNVQVQPRSKPLSDRAIMQFGNHPYYGGALIFTSFEAYQMIQETPISARFIRPLYGSKEFISAAPRACLWIPENAVDAALKIPQIAAKVSAAREARLAAKQDKTAQKLAETPYKFREQVTASSQTLIVPRVSSENRPYLPIGLLESNCIIQEKAFALYDAPLWNMALIASRLHWVWIGTVCVRMRTDFSYSNTLGWNTFPVPVLTAQNKTDLTRCAEDILLARESHFPATIAELYDPAKMPANLRAAHDRNDETLERIYLGRRFKNDTERLEKLFELYTQMTAKTPAKKAARRTKGGEA